MTYRGERKRRTGKKRSQKRSSMERNWAWNCLKLMRMVKLLFINSG